MNSIAFRKHNFDRYQFAALHKPTHQQPYISNSRAKISLSLFWKKKMLNSMPQVWNVKIFPVLYVILQFFKIIFVSKLHYNKNVVVVWHKIWQILNKIAKKLVCHSLTNSTTEIKVVSQPRKNFTMLKFYRLIFMEKPKI